MTISPKTYETVGHVLGLSAQKLTADVGEALTDVHKKVIDDPDSITQAGEEYDTKVNKALEEWNEEWKDWADGDLATAYLQGTVDVDELLETELETVLAEELDALKIRRTPDQPISDQTPLAGKLDGILPPKDIPAHLRQAFTELPNHLTHYNVFRRAAHHSMEGASLQVMRATKDLYRDVAVQAGSKMFRESDVYTRRALSQSMLDDFAKRGIQCVTYKDGKRVSIEAYSEMVGRTMAGNAAVQAAINRYEEYGFELVRVSSHFRACELCVDWEGQVLLISGPSKSKEVAMTPPIAEAPPKVPFHLRDFDISPKHAEKTKPELQEYLKVVHGIDADIDDMDLNSARATVDELDALGDRYPEVMEKHLNKIRTIELRDAYGGRGAFGSYNAQEQRITYNSLYFRDGHDAAMDLRAHVRDGFLAGPPDAQNPADYVRLTTRHEFGHAVAARYADVHPDPLADTRTLGKDAWMETRYLGGGAQKEGMSAYSLTNHSELAAEGFSMYESGNYTPISEAVGYLYEEMESGYAKLLEPKEE